MSLLWIFLEWRYLNSLGFSSDIEWSDAKNARKVVTYSLKTMNLMHDWRLWMYLFIYDIMIYECIYFYDIFYIMNSFEMYKGKLCRKTCPLKYTWHKDQIKTTLIGFLTPLPLRRKFKFCYISLSSYSSINIFPMPRLHLACKFDKGPMTDQKT